MTGDTFQHLIQRFEDGDRSVVPAIFDLAAEGDAEALLKTAEFRMRAIGGPTDLVDAFDRTRRAASSGLEAARFGEIYLTASGIGRTADPTAAFELLKGLAASVTDAARQVAMLLSMGPLRVTRTIISRAPRICVFHGLLSQDECDYIRRLADPDLVPAMIYAASGEGMRDPHRDSDNMVITPLAEDLVIQSFLGRIADVTHTDIAHGEPLHVLRYRPGQQYRPHHDAHAFTPIPKRRHQTAILYLNNDYEGGATTFPELGIEVRGVPGDLLVFDNLTADGEPDLRMLHAGNPVTKGEKWIATRWIRGSDYFGR
jgi:prolyl 4-hydroxylase